MWEKVLDKGRYIYAYFMDLSKAFDSLHHGLIVTKLGTHGCETGTQRYMKSYLINLKQRAGANKTSE